jgi:hypothetical protein
MAGEVASDLLEALEDVARAGPVAHLGQTGSFYRGLRTDPLMRLVVLVECGTRGGDGR